MQTQTPPTTKKAPRYSVMKNDSLGFVKVNKTTVFFSAQLLDSTYSKCRITFTSTSKSADYCFP